MKASVYKSTGSWYIIKSDEGKMYNARIKGLMKIEGITSTNPVAVGDEVAIEVENETQQSAMITEVLPRRNYVARQSPSNRKQHHIVAANLDQSLLVATLREPRTSQGFIDRFLVTCEAYHIPAIIVFNKSDLYRKKEIDLYEAMKFMYEEIGYKVFLTSVVNNSGLEDVISLMSGKQTLISGHSGVGKSSFINILLPDLQLKTQDVSGWSGKGLHTTTFAEMFDLPLSGRIIDTPGMREFGIIDISKQELSHYYPEMRQRLNDCQFNNCLHVNEPGCAIKAAVESEAIDLERYVSYVNILDTIDDKNY